MCVYIYVCIYMVFPGVSVVKNPLANAGDTGLIPGLGRCPGEGNGNPFQYSCLGNPMDRGAGGLQSMGSQRVRHDLATKQQQHAYTRIHTHTLLVLFLWKTLRHWQSFTSRSKLDLSREAHNKIHHTVASGCPWAFEGKQACFKVANS